MQKRKYTQPKAVAGLILSMREDGMTSQKIAYELGLILKQMKNWLFRHTARKGICSRVLRLNPKADHGKMVNYPSKISRRNCID